MKIWFFIHVWFHEFFKVRILEFLTWFFSKKFWNHVGIEIWTSFKNNSAPMCIGWIFCQWLLKKRPELARERAHAVVSQTQFPESQLSALLSAQTSQVWGVNPLTTKTTVPLPVYSRVFWISATDNRKLELEINHFLVFWMLF